LDGRGKPSTGGGEDVEDNEGGDSLTERIYKVCRGKAED